jgi:hypothetical protein
MRLKTYLMLCILTFSIGSGIGFVWPTIAQTPQQPSPQPQFQTTNYNESLVYSNI